MSEQLKPNDIFVSTLVNGNKSALDLTANGITAENTQLLDPQSYRDSKLVLKAFTGENGVFNEDMFMLAYTTAAQQYQDLTAAKQYKNLEQYVEFNKNDIFAPLNSKKAEVSYEYSPEINPQRRSHGVDSLFDYGKSTKSMRELAQMSKIWDSENQVWLDKTADERGLLGSLFGQSLVYATYDEDTDVEDPLTGRIVHHKKGEWKLNDKGQYYTETLGNRQSYGKLFVAASDTLTKEDSALNKIDFFDSDDLEKSIPGMVFKTAAKMAPYIFPQTRLIWGGVTGAIAMSKILPTLAKVAEGVFVGGDAENESAFTRSMNAWENYMGKFAKSYSDKGMSSNWSGEKMLDLVADVFAQLYQMRAAASISTLVKRDPTAKAMAKFEKEFSQTYIMSALKEGSGLSLSKKELDEIALMAAKKMPEVKAAIEAQTALSSALSRGYMALISGTDVYQDALEGGYDRRSAGLATIAAILGQYGIMGIEGKYDLGGWFLDPSVGYSKNADRAALIKAIRPYYDDIAKGVDELSGAAAKEEKAGVINRILGKVSKGLSKGMSAWREDGQIYWRNAVTEGIEEVTEEAVMDATKGAFDFLSWAGIGNKNASFGTVEDFKSGNFLERYLQNAVGGFMGGALFEFQQRKVEPWMNKAFYGVDNTDIQPSLIHEIANGHTDDIYKAIDELSKVDDEVAVIPIDINGTAFSVTANKDATRGLAVAAVLKNYVNILEGALVGENADLTDDQLLVKAVRDYLAINILKKGGLDRMLITDFSKLSSEIASIKLALNNLEQKAKDAKEQKTEDGKKVEKPTEKEATPKEEIEEHDDGKYDNKSKKFLEELLSKKRAQLKDFLSGKNAEDYLYKTLVGATPEIKSAVGDLSIYDFVYLKYGKDWKDINRSKGVINQKKIRDEYDAWKKETDADKRFMALGVEAYADFDKRFSKYILDYQKSQYTDVRKKVLANLLSPENFTIEQLLDKEESYKELKKIVNLLKAEGTGDFTILDIFKLDNKIINKKLELILDANPTVLKLFETLGKTKELMVKELSDYMVTTLQSVNIDLLSDSVFTGLLTTFYTDSLTLAFDSMMNQIPEGTPKNVKALTDLLQSKGLLSPTGMMLALTAMAASDPETLFNVFRDNFSIQTGDVSIGLGTSLLGSYILSEDTVDGEIVKRLAEEANKSILRDINKSSKDIINALNSLLIVDDYDVDDEGDTISTNIFTFKLTSDNFKELLDQINNTFDSVDPIKTIKDWATTQLTKLLTGKFGENIDLSAYTANELSQILDLNNFNLEDAVKRITDYLIPILDQNELYSLYKESKLKTIKENTIYDSLSNIDLALSESGRSKVIDVLKNQHIKLRAAEKFEDYLPLGEIKEQLENALKALLLYRALTIGMAEQTLGLGVPFAVNMQMKRFLEKSKITSTRNYETIDIDSAQLINKDILLIESQIKGYLKLVERAYQTKSDLDAIIKKQHSKLILDYINQNATAFTIHDFSLLPPENERAAIQGEEKTLITYASHIFKTFNEHFKTPEEKRAAIAELIKNLNLDVSKITRGSKPQNLNRELTAIEDFDVLLWVATALGSDTLEFYYRYNQLIVANEHNKNTPLYSQEQAALLAWSFLRDENNVRGEEGELISVHAAIIKELFKANPNINALEASNLFFINGITGAGKTTVAGSILAALLSDKLLYVTAANKKQIDNYKASIKKHYPEKDALLSGTINTFLEKLLTKEGVVKINEDFKDLCGGKNIGEYFKLKLQNALFNYKEIRYQLPSGEVKSSYFAELNPQKIDQYLRDKIDLDVIPEVLFIDEATQISQPMLQLLNYLAGKYNFKVLLSGDSTQRGKKLGPDSQAFNDLFMWKAAKLNISVRASNNQIATNNVSFNRLLEEYEKLNIVDPEHSDQQFSEFIRDPKNNLVISYYLDDSTLNGYKFVESLLEHAEDIKLIGELNKKANSLDQHHQQKVMVITKLDAASKPENAGLIELLANNGLLLGDYEFFSYEDTHDQAAQGSEARYVIVDTASIISDLALGVGNRLRAVYTLASRAQNGALMVLPQEILHLLGILNRKDRITQVDAIPQLSDVQKLKETRKKELEAILGTTTKPELAKLKTKEVGDKKVPIRSSALKINPTSKKSSTSKKSASEKVTDIDHESDTQLSEENELLYIDSINKDPLIEVTEAQANLSGTQRKNLYITPPTKEPKQTTRVYPTFLHLGVKEKEGSIDGWLETRETYINFDFDGLFDKNRLISPAVQYGFTAFRHLLIAAKSKEEVAEGIRTNKYIGAFLMEACPMVAVNLGLSLKNQTADGISEAYARWFYENVDIDNNYYVFAKKYEWDYDKPRNIDNPNIADSVGEGNPALYYGVRLKSKDGMLNQYVSIAELSKIVDKNGTKCDSEALQALHTKAIEDLKLSPAGFVAYLLPSTKLFDINISSTLWLRNIKKKDGEGINYTAFDSVRLMKKRGFSIDEDNIYLVDSSKVQVNGKAEYKALVLLASLGLTAADINEAFADNKLTFELRLEKLKEAFVDKDGNLRVAGSYLAMSRYADPEIFGDPSEDNRHGIFNRALFLNPAATEAFEVFKDLGWSLEKGSAAGANWRSKLARCRPSSQTALIAAILDHAKAFEHTDTLLKYLVGTKDKLIEIAPESVHKRDRKAINNMIDFVKGRLANGQIVTKEEFINMMNKNGHRTLLMPFFRQFVHRDGSEWILRKVTNSEAVTINGQYTLNFAPSDKNGGIRLAKSHLPDSYACPPLVKSSEPTDVAKQFEVKLPETVKDQKFNFLQIAFNASGEDYLGVYGFMLQDPVAQIHDDLLKNFQKVTERLEQLPDDKRFPDRTPWLDVATKPEGFDPTRYFPKKLKVSDYYVDADFKDRVGTTEDKSKPKVDKTEKKYDKKEGKWKVVKVTTKKNGVEQPVKVYPRKFSGVFIKKGTKGGSIKTTVYNSLGFEVRPGDYVQLWGDESCSYYVSDMDVTSDPKNPQMILTKVGDPDGLRTTMLPLGKSDEGKKVSIEGVTAVVKRTIPKSDDLYIKDDIYHTGNFKVVSKWKQGDYKIVEKSADTMLELISAALNGEDVGSLDFDKYWYYLVPITNEDLNNTANIDNPRRPGGRIVESIQSLRDFHEEYSDAEVYPTILGYTLYRIYRSTDEDPQAWLSHLDDLITKIEEVLSKDLVAALGSPDKKKLSRSSIIQHQVIFNPDLLASVKSQFIIPDLAYIEYDHNEAASKLSKPEELLILNSDGSLNIAETAIAKPKYIELTRKEFEAKPKEAYPSTEWVYEVVAGKNGDILYRLYPKPEFYFKTYKSGDHLEFYYDSADPGVITHKDFNAFIIKGNIDTYGVLKTWKNRLLGYSFRDLQFEAFLPVPSNFGSNEQLRIEKEIRTARQKSIIRPASPNYDSSKVAEFVISDIVIKGGKVYITYKSTSNLNNDGLPESKSILLSDFLVSLGSRFLLLSDVRRQIYDQEVIDTPPRTSVDSTISTVELTEQLGAGETQQETTTGGNTDGNAETDVEITNENIVNLLKELMGKEKINTILFVDAWINNTRRLIIDLKDSNKYPNIKFTKGLLYKMAPLLRSTTIVRYLGKFHTGINTQYIVEAILRSLQEGQYKVTNWALFINTIHEGVLNNKEELIHKIIKDNLQVDLECN